MITIREIDRDADYPMLCKWWEGWGWAPVPMVFLPKLGVVALNDGIPVASGFMLLDNSCPVAQIEWLLTDPEGGMIATAKGLDAVIEFLVARVAEPDLNYAAVLGATRQAGLVRMLERNGFVKTDENMTHLLLIVNPESRAAYKASLVKSPSLISQ